jgi:glycosyltransferase involved in cell wall biosynthesis
MKIGFVVQRYGEDIIGGAEYHCRLIVKYLKPHFDIEVFTSKANDYITWKDYYRDKITYIDGVKVNRFSVSKKRNPIKFGKIQQKVFEKEHTEKDELKWIEEEGPNLPKLIKEIKNREEEFDFFIFFSFRYYHSFHGIKMLPQKSILVPTAEPDPTLYLKVFRPIFNLPRAIVYNSWEEKRIINLYSNNYNVPGDVVGVGSEIPYEYNENRFRKKYGIEDKFLLYIGRIDKNKGVDHLFDFFQKYKKGNKDNLKLVLIGKEVFPIPEDEDIIYVGAVSDEDKFDALSAAEILMMPSFYESLSMVTIESWALRKPVIVNGGCPVLKDQIIRSGGGLYYNNYFEFKEALEYILNNKKIYEKMGEKGRAFYEENYTWNRIVEKYLKLIEKVGNRR